VERYTIEVPDEAADVLREQAAANGRSVEDEIGGLVERTLAKRTDDDWIGELIALTRPGVDIRFPIRSPAGRVIPFQYDDFD
jgi:plasmid stability protein